MSKRWQRRILAAAIPITAALLYAADRTDILPVCLLEPVGVREVRIVANVDGDTLEDECGRRIRVIGADTPEMSTMYGPAASAFTTAWLGPDARVNLEICRQQPFDRYGRLLAHVRRLTDQADLTAALLEHGWAAALIIPPCGIDEAVTQQSRMRAARGAHLGMWVDFPVGPLNAAAARLRAPGYVVVEDRVREVRVEKSNTLLLLGDRRGDIEIAVPHRDRPRLAAAGIDLQRLAGTCVRSEGKLGNKGQRPRLWVSHPAWLEVTACAPTRADPADGNTVRSNKPHPARSKKARTGKVKPH